LILKISLTGGKKKTMIKIFLTKGAPASGKSTWAKAEVAKDPLKYLHINNDDLRQSFNGSVYSADYEKLITETRNFLIREGIKRGMNIIIDNVNANNRHWDMTCKIAKEANKDIQVLEKLFYSDLEELLERNAKREGSARVPDDVLKKFYKDLGGKQFRFSNPKVEIFNKRNYTLDTPFTPAVQDINLPTAIISDLDGTLALFAGKRSPYDAKDCDLIDEINRAVQETIELYHADAHQIIFCSGREDKFEPETRRFIGKHLPNIKYKLFMRKTDDMRKDSIIKEEIYRNNIEGKYFVKLVLDDRNQVVSLWRSLGLVCFQVAPGDF
jgi:predicted kinase